jgi:hypothetical protein
LAQALIHTPDLEALYVAKTQIDTLVFSALRHVPRLKRLSLAACDGLLTSPDAVRTCGRTAAARSSPRFGLSFAFFRLTVPILALRFTPQRHVANNQQILKFFARLAQTPLPLEWLDLSFTSLDEQGLLVCFQAKGAPFQTACLALALEPDIVESPSLL